MPRITQAVAMGVGAAGAMTDVSSTADLAAGVSRVWGKQLEFDDAQPGQFSFTLDNPDGRYTPGNTASALATTVTEGMTVCWQLGTRLVSGTVRSIEPMFPAMQSAWAQVRVTCDDQLGSAARVTFTNFPKAMVAGSGPLLYWPLNDAVTSTYAAEQYGAPSNGIPSWQLGLRTSTGGSFAFGAAGFTANALDSQVTLSATTSQDLFLSSNLNGSSPSQTFTYPTGTAGYWGFWATVLDLNAVFALTVTSAGSLFSTIFCDMTGTGLVNAQGKDGTGVSSTSKLQVGVPAYLAVKLTVVASRIVTELFVNGVSQGTGTTTTATYSATTQTISQVDLELKLPPAASNVVFSHLSHTTYPVNESAAASGVTEAQALAGLASTVQGFTLATLPAGLSGAPLAAISGGSGSTLDQMNTIIRTEQGAIYTTTSGTITSPTQTVTIRERTRPSTVTYSFDLERELQDAPDFVRDITNMVSSVTASGPTQSVIVYNSAYVARVGSKNTSDTISNRDAGDLTLWAQDRLLRGANVALRAVSFTVDAMTTPTDRSADLLAMVPGDRIRVTNLPNTQLGFTTWDGWLLGVNESHSLTEHTFTIYLQPVLPATGIFDTDLWGNGGNNTISTALTSVALTVNVTSADLITYFEQTTFPYTLLIESEQVTVSAATAPAAGVQTLTIARAANGTTAAAHAIGVTPEVLPATNIFAF